MGLHIFEYIIDRDANINLITKTIFLTTRKLHHTKFQRCFYHLLYYNEVHSPKISLFQFCPELFKLVAVKSQVICIYKLLKTFFITLNIARFSRQVNSQTI